MWGLLSVAVANFANIFFRAFQQRNVAFNKYKWVLPTSMMMALAEVLIIAKVASNGFGFELVLAIGLSGGCGAMTSMLVHNRLMKD